MSDDMTREPGSGFRKVLQSSSRTRPVPDWEAKSRDMDPSEADFWMVRSETLEGGKQDGVQVITVDNGRLSYRICPTRGMGLLDARLEEVRLGWDSPVREVVHPRYMRLESRGGLGWLEGFNEWVVRCGLESAGAPGADRFVTNTGEQAQTELTLHGRIANTPASEVEVRIGEKTPRSLEVAGQVEECLFYGPKLRLRTRVTTTVGSNVVRIEDVVTNRGAAPQEFQLIYHANFGPPLLEEGARFLAPIKSLFPINEHSARGVDRFDSYRGPQTGFVEEVFCIEPLASANGNTTVMLANGARNRAVLVRVSVDTLPCLSLWKSTGALEDGYVTGIEPGTGFPYNRGVERKFGRVPLLEPGESRLFRLEFAVLDSSAQVKEAEAEIAGIQGSHQVEIKAPPEL